MSPRDLRPLVAVLLPLLAAVAVQVPARATTPAKSGASPVPSRAPAVAPPAKNEAPPPPAKSNDAPPPAPKNDAPPPAKSNDAPPPAKANDAPPPAKSNDIPPPAKSDAPPPMAPSQSAPPPSVAPVSLPVQPPPAPPSGPVYKTPPPNPSPGTGVMAPQPGFSVESPSLEAMPSEPGSVTGPMPEPVRPTTSHVAPKPRNTIEGRFRSESNGDIVSIRRTREGCYYLVGPDWDGVGFFDGQLYRGVFRFEASARETTFAGAAGWHFIEVDGDALQVQSELETEARDRFRDTWTQLPPDPEAQGVLSAETSEPYGAGGDRGAGVDNVSVDELPVAIRRVSPRYPETARARGVEGTVTVRAHVLKDGSVGDVRVVQSVPALDEAAMDCVRQWEFKPAIARGKPVASWVVVPLKFDRQTAGE